MRATLWVIGATLLIGARSAAQVVRVADTVAAATDRYGDAARSASSLAMVVEVDLETQLAVSNDGGQTWNRRTTSAAGGNSRVALSASVVVDLVSRATPTRHFRSTDLGATWSPPHDLPLAIEWSLHPCLATSAGGIIAAADFTSTRELHVVTSSDGGATWSTDVTLASGASVLGYPSLTWLSANELLACWAASSNRLLCARSVDAGASFGPASTAAQVAPSGGGSVAVEHGVAARSPTDVVIGLSAYRVKDLAVTRSTDGGATWTPSQTLASTGVRYTYSRPSLSSSTSGEVWLAASAADGANPAETSELWVTSDGILWNQAPSLPTELTCGHFAAIPQILADGPGELWYRGTLPAWSVPSGVGWSSFDAATTWSSPIELGPTRTPTQEVRVTRITSGRLVAMWLEGTGLEPRLMASVSDDDGITWSAPPVVASDAPVSDRYDYAPTSNRVFSPNAVDHHTHRFEVIPLQSGELVVLWLARGLPSSCGELRATRSTDGSTFQPSVTVGDFDGFPLSVAEDGAQTVVAAWLLGVDIMTSRSLDGGATWSAPAIAASALPTDERMLVTEIAAIADGTLGIGVIHNGVSSPGPLGPLRVDHLRSSNGGLSWQSTTLFNRAQAKGYQPTLIDAGTRLVMIWEGFTHSGNEFYQELWNFESRDFGASFTQLPSDPGWKWMINPSPVAIGDDTGNVYWPFPYDFVWVHRPGDNGRTVFAFLPSNGNAALEVEPSFLNTGGNISILFADWTTRPPAGVFYTAIPCSCRVTSGPPASLRSCNAQPVTLSVTAGPNPSYQWYDASGPILGETRPDLTLTGPVIDGIYRVAVSNECGGSFSNNSVVTIAEPPSVVDAPRAETLCEGTPLALTVTATDTTSFVWSRNGLPIPGATASSYALTAATADDAGQYSVAITGPCGSATSPTATVAIDVPLGAIASRLHLTRAGSDLRFEWNDVPAARGYELREDATPGGPFTTVAGTAMRGTPGLTIPLPAPSRFYRLAGTNACGSGAP